MKNLLDYLPKEKNTQIDFQEIFHQFEFFQPLEKCPQDPKHHAEGNVWKHTQMVVSELLSSEDWENLNEQEKKILFLAALMHDISKPETTKILDDGSITQPGHSKKGSIKTRGILWKMNIDPNIRENVCDLIAYHQIPFWLIEKKDIESKQFVISFSQKTKNKYLAILAKADIKGRICQDKQKILEHISLFEEIAKENNVFEDAYNFPSEHTRLKYIKQNLKKDSDNYILPNYELYNDCLTHVTLLTGLPGSGKTTWINENAKDRAIVSADNIRKDLKISPTDNQGTVIQLVKEMAKSYLRDKKPFVWDATHLSKQIREPIIQLLLDYKAYIEIVHIEKPEKELRAGNLQRPNPVPNKAIDKMILKWEIPDYSECHKLTKIFNK